MIPQYKGKNVMALSIITKIKTDDGVWHDMSTEIEDGIWELSDKMFDKLEYSK
jgi:hypothetical protein